jgi:hypothetical protein
MIFLTFSISPIYGADWAFQKHVQHIRTNTRTCRTKEKKPPLAIVLVQREMEFSLSG